MYCSLRDFCEIVNKKGRNARSGGGSLWAVKLNCLLQVFACGGPGEALASRGRWDEGSQLTGTGLCCPTRAAQSSEPALVYSVSSEGNPRFCVGRDPKADPTLARPGCSREVSGIAIPAGTCLALCITATQRHKSRMAGSKNPCPKSPERQEKQGRGRKNLEVIGKRCIIPPAPLNPSSLPSWKLFPVLACQVLTGNLSDLEDFAGENQCRLMELGLEIKQERQQARLSPHGVSKTCSSSVPKCCPVPVRAEDPAQPSSSQHIPAHPSTSQYIPVPSQHIPARPRPFPACAQQWCGNEGMVNPLHSLRNSPQRSDLV